MNPDWTHTITPPVGAGRVVDPGGDWEIAIKGAWEDFPFCRDYRLKIDGDIVLSGDDYTWIVNQACFSQLDYEIKCNGTVIWNGFVSYPLDFEIDQDTCRATCIPSPNDKYRIFDETADNPYQLEDEDKVIAWETLPPGNDVWTCRDNATLVYDLTHELLEDTVGPAAAAAQPLSTFFWNDIQPDGINIGTHNYVTLNDPNELNLFGFVMADNIANDTNPDYPEFTWNEWMTLLHNFYNVWWYIDDEDGKIRIEHIRWWEGFYFGAGDNLTTLDGGAWIENKNKYKYLTDEMPGTEVWDNGDENIAGNDFTINIILYPGERFNPPRTYYFWKTYPLTEVCTDVVFMSTRADDQESKFMFLHLLDYTDYLWTDPGNTAPDGIARPNLPTACAGVPPDYVVWYELGVSTAANQINGHMAIANIIDAYWQRWRPQIEGQWMGVPTIFDSQEPLVLQSELAYPKCCAHGDNEYQFQIVTQFGNGYIRAGSLMPDGMLSKLELLHNIVCE